MKKIKGNHMNSIQFEEGYMFRNNRGITTSSDIALTELVANAWDAGALNVEINLPTNEDETMISVSDDGCGMSKEEFKERWMTLNYNREKHQGKYVVFPEDVVIENKNRIAYGRNGVGRHGMLCFSDKYSVETWKDGKGYRYVISVSSGDEPYSVISQNEIKKKGHGTTISSFIERNRPDISYIKEILSARFVYDPQFSLKINGEELNLSSSGDVVKREMITTEDDITLDVAIVDSTKTAQISKRHGVAFWIGGRLVGNPSWSYGKYQFMDARYRIARRYTIIVQSNDSDIINDVLPDWTGFYDTQRMDNVYSEVNRVIKELVSGVMSETISDLKKDVISEKWEELDRLTIADKRDVSAFMDIMTENNPMIGSDFLSTSIDALLQIQQAKRGTELLSQLSSMSPDELDNLTDLLNKWDINDVVNVIDGIDKRIVVVEAISRIYENQSTDELHTLHPMVLKATWLFGAEFDSPMFISNRSLSTLIKSLFREDEYDLEAIANPRKRPDIVCLNRSTIRAVCTDKIDTNAGEIMKPDQILIIELKRGGYEIGQSEVNQAENYVHQIKKSAVLHKDATIHAFVVGAEIGDIAAQRKTEDGLIDVVTYGHLVQTAKTKLFGLKEKLEEHYDSIDDKSLVEMALKEPRQMSF